MKQVLNDLFDHKFLDKARAKQVLVQLAQGEYNNSQVASFMTVFLMRSITVQELEGFRDAMLELCLKIDLSEFDAMDLCGTGGDGKDTFNISTVASFIVAGAGQSVVKHGNNGVSSFCGSSNLLAHFGYQFTNDADKLKTSLEKSGICFLHAPLFHPAMKNVAPIRKELGVKTFFNMLGPMVNPTRPKKQLVGVFSLELARLYAYLYQQAALDFMILHSLDGYDEISLTGPFKVISNHGEELIQPEDLGLSKTDPADLSGGETIEESAQIFSDILDNKATKPQESVALANAAMALFTAGKSPDPKGALEIARESLESGRARLSFKKLIELNQANAN